MVHAQCGTDGGKHDAGDDRSSRLRSIASRLAAFVDQQLQRCDAMAQCHEDVLRREAAVQQQREALADEQKHWDQRRLEQIEELRQESELLHQAWARLENEQRQLLAQEAKLNAVAPRGNSELRPTDCDSPSNSPAPREAAIKTNMQSEDVCRQSVVRQFQQLGREIGRHARRNR